MRAIDKIWRTTPDVVREALRRLERLKPDITLSTLNLEKLCAFLYDRSFAIDIDDEVLVVAIAMYEDEEIEWSIDADPSCRRWMDVYNLANRLRSAGNVYGCSWTVVLDHVGVRHRSMSDIFEEDFRQ